ncbi:hypothetical protein M5K25_008578 [Dendrobium thyrsiflorum]|uniref:Uncharacterized protein n=1 Tax=Dendrobium thyrsiflorum TaxID=117978 RepID=A0ABD0V9N2_DENTH
MANHEPLNNCDKALFQPQVRVLNRNFPYGDGEADFDATNGMECAIGMGLHDVQDPSYRFQFFTTDVPNLGSRSALPTPNIAAATNAWKQIGMESNDPGNATCICVNLMRCSHNIRRRTAYLHVHSAAHVLLH